jgi:hypothetical protein
MPNWWEKGKPVGQQQGGIISDPNAEREQARDDQSLGLDAERVRIAREAESRQRATLPADVRRAEAEAVKSEAQAAAAVKEQALAPKPETARIQQAIKTSALLDALNTARSQIGQGWATGNFAGTGTFQGVPGVGQNSTNLAATISGLQGSIINDTLAQLKAQSASGASGYGSLTESEAQRLAAAVGALQQTQDKESLLRNLARVEKHYRNALALSYGEDPRIPEVAQKYGIVESDDKAVPGANPPSGGGQVTSEGTTGVDPALKGLNATVARMVRDGKDARQIRDYLNAVRPGMGDAAQDVESVVAYGRQNPDKPALVDLEKIWTPNSGLSQMLGDIGMSPIGAGVIGAADAVTMGTLDNLTPNPELTRATMEGVSQENPWSYTLGQIGGGAATGLGLEAGLARAGLTGMTGVRTGEALYGAGYGAGATDDPEDSRVTGALLGTGAGLAGGALGRGASRVGGNVIGGLRDEVVQALNAAGVRMTPGQMFGGSFRRTEDRLGGLPLVGDQIRARRIEGMEDFNRAAFEEAVDPINGPTNGVIAEPGVEILRSLRTQAYDNALGPVQVTADAPFVNDLGGAIRSAQALPETMADNAEYTLRTRIGESIDPSGSFTGRDYQQMLRGLRRDASAVSNLPYGYDFGQVTQQAESALEGVLERQSPGTVEALRTANEVNRNVETIRAAVNAARNGGRTGSPGVFAPSQLSDAAAMSAKKFGNSQGTTNQPFYDLTRAGQAVLPDTIGDSGTAGRNAIAAALFAGGSGGAGYAASDGSTAERAGTGVGTAAAVSLLLAAPYSPVARDALQRLFLSQRPTALQRAGDFMTNNDTVAGLLAAPALVEYTAGP